MKYVDHKGTINNEMKYCIYIFLCVWVFIKKMSGNERNM